MRATEQSIRRVVRGVIREISQGNAVRRRFCAVIQRYGDVEIPVTERSHMKDSMAGRTAVTGRNSARMMLSVSEMVDPIQRRQYRKSRFIDQLTAERPDAVGTKHFTLEARRASGEAEDAWHGVLSRIEELEMEA